MFTWVLSDSLSFFNCLKHACQVDGFSGLLARMKACFFPLCVAVFPSDGQVACPRTAGESDAVRDEQL